MKVLIAILLCSTVLVACNDRGARPANTVASKALGKDSISDEEPVRDKHMSVIDSIGELSALISKFIPQGYQPLDTAIGDLNLDGINDLLLVIRKKGEDTLSDFGNGHEEKRPLLILLGQPDNGYVLARKNEHVVMCIDCSGVMVRSDPFTGLKIKDGYFSVEHGVAEGPQHWETVTTFKYDKEQKEWFLFKDGAVRYELDDDPGKTGDAMKKAYEKVRTRKDFGNVSFEQYDLARE